MNVRQDIVYLYEEEHLSERDIAKQLQLSPSTVHYWIVRRGQKTKRKGRPRVTDSIKDEEIYQTSLKNPFLTAVDIRRDIAPTCSVDTVRNRLKQQGLKSCKAARKPFITEEHCQNRFAFANSYLHWSSQEWQRVIFSDEKIFRSNSNGILRVYRPKKSDRYDKSYLAPSTNIGSLNKFTVCVWMAFGGHGHFLKIHRVEQKTLNTDYYLDKILTSIESHVAEDDASKVKQLIFMQDLSSIHTSYRTHQWLREHNIRVMDDWPPKGPDMNPVENVWAELVRRIELKRRKTGVQNINQLWEDVLQCFYAIPETYFKKLIDSMPTRVRTVSQRRGGWTKY